MSDLDRYLTDEVVENAAKALYEDGWNAATWEAKQYHREAAVRSLSAVLPDIIRQAKAEAWEQGHRATTLEWEHVYDGHDCAEGEMCPTCCQPNPYRADRIEQGGQP